jgi:hypothetical protein
MTDVLIYGDTFRSLAATRCRWDSGSFLSVRAQRRPAYHDRRHGDPRLEELGLFELHPGEEFGSTT